MLSSERKVYKIILQVALQVLKASYFRSRHGEIYLRRNQRVSVAADSGKQEHPELYSPLGKSTGREIFHHAHHGKTRAERIAGRRIYYPQTRQRFFHQSFRFGSAARTAERIRVYAASEYKKSVYLENRCGRERILFAFRLYAASDDRARRSAEQTQSRYGNRKARNQGHAGVSEQQGEL